VSCPWSHTAVRATRRVRRAVAEAVKASRRLWKSKELTDLTGSNCDILSLKAECKAPKFVSEKKMMKIINKYNYVSVLGMY
jgi:hypothetical protein